MREYSRINIKNTSCRVPQEGFNNSSIEGNVKCASNDK